MAYKDAILLVNDTDMQAISDAMTKPIPPICPEYFSESIGTLLIEIKNKIADGISIQDKPKNNNVFVFVKKITFGQNTIINKPGNILRIIPKIGKVNTAQS